MPVLYIGFSDFVSNFQIGVSCWNMAVVNASLILSLIRKSALAGLTLIVVFGVWRHLERRNKSLGRTLNIWYVAVECLNCLALLAG